MTPRRIGPTALVVASLGIVFGDLGTSPLYTLQECFTGPHGVPPTQTNVLGVISLVTWSLVAVVTVKYLAFLMRADNRGEGGIFALLALLPERRVTRKSGGLHLLAWLIVAGAALLFGDGVITPAVSVLSAVEGLGVATTALEPAVLPITVAILVGLFAIQRRGTGALSAAFGPVMLVWFVTIAVLGAAQLAKNPSILGALSPHHAARFFSENGIHGAKVLGGVVLAVTGGEALYADMGHFGRSAIQRAWLVVCLPALLLSYFGQGALLLVHPEAAERPFYAMCPSGPALYPFVALAAVATVIASQALISGVFSLTHQAMRLGFLPRMTVKHTSDHVEGQIYLPFVNLALAVACILVVVLFKKSSALAAAFGLAVAGTMAITTLAFGAVAREVWTWSRTKTGIVVVAFLAFDIPFFLANLAKLADGGWLPLLLGTGIVAIMVNWFAGRRELAAHFRAKSRDLCEVVSSLGEGARKLPGVGVFMSSDPKGAPPVLVTMVERFRALYELNVLLTVRTEHVPLVAPEERAEIVERGDGFVGVVLRYGFTETTRVPDDLRAALVARDPSRACEEVTFVLGRETILVSKRGRMSGLWELLFSVLSRNARNATDHFDLPPERVVELGSQVDL